MILSVQNPLRHLVTRGMATSIPEAFDSTRSTFCGMALSLRRYTIFSSSDDWEIQNMQMQNRQYTDIPCSFHFITHVVKLRYALSKVKICAYYSRHLSMVLFISNPCATIFSTCTCFICRLISHKCRKCIPVLFRSYILSIYVATAPGFTGWCFWRTL